MKYFEKHLNNTLVVVVMSVTFASVAGILSGQILRLEATWWVIFLAWSGFSLLLKTVKDLVVNKYIRRRCIWFVHTYGVDPPFHQSEVWLYGARVQAVLTNLARKYRDACDAKKNFRPIDKYPMDAPDGVRQAKNEQYLLDEVIRRAQSEFWTAHFLAWFFGIRVEDKWTMYLSLGMPREAA